MTETIAFEKSSVERMQALAAAQRFETCASALVFPAGTRNGHPRYVVSGLKEVPDTAYAERSEVRAVLSPAYCVELANMARANGGGVLLAHTHPGPRGMDEFSLVDDRGERALAAYFNARLPGRFHATALFTAHGGRCRQLASTHLAHMQVVGSEVAWMGEAAQKANQADVRFDRQIRAFGLEAQQRLSTIRVGIIGLGGTGSFIATELAYLGVNQFLLIDKDTVEDTNLNRLLGALQSDAGKQKVEVSANWIKTINPESRVDQVVGDVVDEAIASELRSVDFIFVCTDSHASRAVANQIAYQYLIPSIDMGVAIHTTDSIVDHVVGRAQMISAGLGCLVCSGWIDPNQVRLEMMSAELRRKDPYFKGEGVPQPAVISLNGTVSSLATTIFLAAMAAIPSQAKLLLYDAIRGSVRPTLVSPQSNCIVCSESGALGKGDSWLLPVRRAND